MYDPNQTQSAAVENVGVRTVNTGAGEVRSEVSNQWWSRPDDERFLSLGALRDNSKAAYDNSRAAVYESKAIEVLAPEVKAIEDTRKLAMVAHNGDGAEPMRPTHWSFGQACSLIQAPASYLRRMPSQIVADAMNWGLLQHRSEMVKVYHRLDGTRELRAFTGPDYGRIPDHQVIEALMEHAGQGVGDARWKVPGKFVGAWGRYDPNHPVTKDTTTIFGSDRDIFVFLVDDRNPIEVGTLANGEPDYIFRGFYVWNSEVGARSCGIATMYLRGVCCNRLLWGVEGFREVSMRHSKYAPDRFVAEAMPALNSYASGSVQDVVEGVAEAKRQRIASNEEEGLDFLRKRGASRKQALRMAALYKENEGGRVRTVWDAAQAITYLAGEEQQQDKRLEIDKMAGTLLNKVTV